LPSFLFFHQSPEDVKGGRWEWKNHRLLVTNAPALRLGLGIPRIIFHLLEKEWGWQENASWIAGGPTAEGAGGFFILNSPIPNLQSSA